MAESNPTLDEAEMEDLELGETVFRSDGTELGAIRGFDDAGFYVRVHEDVSRLDEQRSTSGEFGEAYLMWRCWDCGEMGQIQRLPEECPTCGAPKEDLYYWTED